MMYEMTKYIFDQLQNHDNSIKQIKKFCGYQRRFDNKIVCLSLLVTTSLILTEIEKKQMENRIRKLEKEVNELSVLKGE